MDKPVEVIASRTFDALDEKGQSFDTLTVALYHPAAEPDADWSCRYHVCGLGVDRSQRGGFGVDAIQALSTTIDRIGAAVMYEYFRDVKLRWAGSPYFRSNFLRVHLAPEQGLSPEFGEPLAVGMEEVETIYPSRGPMTLSIGHPRRAPSGLWYCPYIVGALGYTAVRWASGFDALHALQSVLYLIHGVNDFNTEIFLRHDQWRDGEALGFRILVRDAEERFLTPPGPGHKERKEGSGE